MRSLREPADVPAELDFGLLKTAIYLARPAAFQREMKTLQDGEKQAFGGGGGVKGRVAVPTLGVEGSSLNQER